MILQRLEEGNVLELSANNYYPIRGKQTQSMLSDDPHTMINK